MERLFNTGCTRERPRDFRIEEIFGVRKEKLTWVCLPIRGGRGEVLWVDATEALALPGHLMLQPVFDHGSFILIDYRLVRVCPPHSGLTPDFVDLGSIIGDSDCSPQEFVRIE